jgi:hypothetical protein
MSTCCTFGSSVINLTFSEQQEFSFSFIKSAQRRCKNKLIGRAFLSLACPFFPERRVNYSKDSFTRPIVLCVFAARFCMADTRKPCLMELQRSGQAGKVQRCVTNIFLIKEQPSLLSHFE